MFATRAEVQAARAAQRGRGRLHRVDALGVQPGGGPRESGTAPWFQLYVMRDRGYAEELMARARAVRSPILVLTVDLAVVGARYRDIRNAVVGAPSASAKAMRGLDLALHPRVDPRCSGPGKPLTFGNLEKAVPGARSPAAFRDWVDAQFDPSVTWDDVAWVREHWERTAGGQGGPRS